jgi:endonuclease YncB( thermonuclease family)
VYVENQMVNAVLLASGLARYSPHHSNNRHDSTLLSAENAARDAQRGIWAGDDVAEVRPA